MSCNERFYKKLKVDLYLKNVTLDEIAAIREFLRERRELERQTQSKPKT